MRLRPPARFTCNPTCSRLQPHAIHAATLCLSQTLCPSQVSVPPFYVAFILAPLASHASECIASYSYAAKKTKRTITVSLAALEGAPCMDTTLCLSP